MFRDLPRYLPNRSGVGIAKKEKEKKKKEGQFSTATKLDTSAAAYTSRGL